jgi:hypothetical protein
MVFVGTAAMAYGAYIGVIEADITISLDIAIGWLIEYALAALLGLFGLWTAIQVIRVTGVGFVNSVVSTVASIADSYELPEDADTPVDEGDDSAEDEV